MIDNLILMRKHRISRSIRINPDIWRDFQNKCKMLNCRYESDLLEMILKRALYPPEKLYKVILAEKIQEFDFLRELKEKAEKEAMIEAKPMQKQMHFR